MKRQSLLMLAGSFVFRIILARFYVKIAWSAQEKLNYDLIKCIRFNVRVTNSCEKLPMKRQKQNKIRGQKLMFHFIFYFIESHFEATVWI